MRQVFRYVSYRVRVAVVMALFAVVPLSLFGMFYFNNEWEKWQTAALGEQKQMLAVSSENLDREILEIESKLFYVSNSVSIRAALHGIEHYSLAEGLDFIKILRETFTSITADNDYLSVCLYSNATEKTYGGYCYPFSKLQQELTKEASLLTRISELEVGKVFTTVRAVQGANHDREQSQAFVYLYMKMIEMKGTECYLEMSMPLKKMINVESSELPDGSIMAVYLNLDDGLHALSLSNDTQDTGLLLDDYYQTGKCQGYYPCVETVDSMPGSQIVCFIPERYVTEQISGNVAQFVGMVLVFLLTVSVCSYMAAAMLTNRITRFLEKMNGELDNILVDPTVVAIGDKDFWGIEKRIRNLIQSVRDSYIKMEQYEVEKNRLELELLQMRFNPHFLYNTLNSIRYQVKDKKVRKSIDSLIHYYRIVLSKGHLRIQIKEEIEMIKEYLELQIFAYDLTNIGYEIAVEEAVKPQKIIKHLLQPIVENALEHGLRANGDQGIIRIRARLDGEDIVFEIEDNGAGMTTEQVDVLLSEPACESVGGGYGVYNVQQRVETYYGKEYGLVFHSKPGEGTCVTLRIPKQPSNN